MLLTHILHPKLINHQREYDLYPLVPPQAWCVLLKYITFGFQLSYQLLISKDTRLWDAVKFLLSFTINISVVCQEYEFIFQDDFLLQHINWNFVVLISTQLCYQLFLNVKAHLPYPWRLNGTVDDELGCGYVCHRRDDIYRVKNELSSHCQSRSMRLLFLWPIIHYDAAISHILDLIPMHLVF